MRLNLRDVVLNQVAALIPLRNRLRRFRDRGRPTNFEAVSELILDRWRTRRHFLGDERIQGATLLEIGSGRELGLAVLLLGLGAKRVINVEIDSYGFIRDAELYRITVEKARNMGLVLPWPPPGLLLNQGGKTVRPDPEKIRLYLGRSADAIPEPDGSVDVTFSVAVLEHPPCPVIPRIARELFRLTRDGGCGYHRIDLADHYTRKTAPFRFLSFSPWEYNLMYGRRGSSSNRYRLDDFERIFREAGFSKIRFEDCVYYEDKERFNQWAKTFHDDFQGRDPEILRVHSAMLVLERSASQIVDGSDQMFL